MKIIADRSICVGAGQCVLAAPELFDQDDNDGLVVVRVAALTPAQRDKAEAAVFACPTRALWLEE
jgi:ferredoxin